MPVEDSSDETTVCGESGDVCSECSEVGDCARLVSPILHAEEGWVDNIRIVGRCSGEMAKAGLAQWGWHARLLDLGSAVDVFPTLPFHRTEYSEA